MTAWHWVRVGALGGVGRFASADAILHARGTRVVVRTPRGLEVGEVLAPPAGGTAGGTGEDTDGLIVRRMTAEDELLAERLARHRHAAWEACSQQIAARGWPVALVEVEHLFDGQSLMFYFLGEAPAELDRLTDELAKTYEARVEFRRFAEALSEGCGPGCGTESAVGHGCGSCAAGGCAIADACTSRARAAD